MARRIAVALVALGLAGCGEVLHLDVEAPFACMSVPNQEVVGSPVEVQGEYSFRITQKFPKGLMRSDGEFHVGLISLALEGGPGADFGFVDSADVLALDPKDEAKPGVRLLRYTKSKPPGRTLSIEAREPIDVSGYVRDRVIKFELLLSGRLPQKTFSMELVVCFDLKASSPYSL